MAAARVLHDAQHAGEQRAVAQSERALGIAARELGDMAASRHWLRRAVARAERIGALDVAALGRFALVATLAIMGRYEAALREADRAAPHLPHPEAGRILSQRATVLMAAGRDEEALAAFGQALEEAIRLGDAFSEANVRNNRGTILARTGQYGPSLADLQASADLFERLGLGRSAADVRQNMGFAAAAAGRIPEALAHFEEADLFWQQAGEVDPVALLDRAEALLGARLVGEATATATDAIAALDAAGMTTFVPQARLLLAEARLLAGDPTTARDEAGRAADGFRRQGRPSWVARARSLRLRAAWEAGERGPRLLAEATRLMAELEAARWPTPAADARLRAGLLALGAGRGAEAQALLAPLAGARRRGPIDLRVRAWDAEARLRDAAGDSAGAHRAIRAGLAAVAAHRAALGATELRAHSSGWADDLARFGTGLALEDGDVRRVFAYAEQHRAGGLRVGPPPDDAELAGLLAELRGAVQAQEQAADAGADAAGRGGALRARQAHLEQAVRRRARTLNSRQLRAGDRPGADARTPGLAALRRDLGDHVLVELVEHGGRLHALAIDARRARLVPLGAVEDVTWELDALRFALQRLARGIPGGNAAGDATAAGEELDRLLLAPLDLPPGRPLVVVPTGPLHAVPWATLPTCQTRATRIAPSAALWMGAATEPPPVWTRNWSVTDQNRSQSQPGAGVALVAGPRLAHAEDEVEDLRARYPDAAVLVGGHATADAVGALLATADLAHVAAHGRFRSDNPLLSALELADGPLTVYDLEQLGRAAGTLVLSACDAGLSSVHAGDELMGLAAALLGLGCRSIIASVVPVPDAGARVLMGELHAHLSAGSPPAEALHRAQVWAAGQGGPVAAAALGFSCFGR